MRPTHANRCRLRRWYERTIRCDHRGDGIHHRARVAHRCVEFPGWPRRTARHFRGNCRAAGSVFRRVHAQPARTSIRSEL